MMSFASMCAITSAYALPVSAGSSDMTRGISFSGSSRLVIICLLMHPITFSLLRAGFTVSQNSAAYSCANLSLFFFQSMRNSLLEHSWHASLSGVLHDKQLKAFFGFMSHVGHWNTHRHGS